MYQPATSREPIWIRTTRGAVVDLREVSSFSLSVKPGSSLKHLVFVWDREALEALKELIDKNMGELARLSQHDRPPSSRAALDQEG